MKYKVSYKAEDKRRYIFLTCMLLKKSTKMENEKHCKENFHSKQVGQDGRNKLKSLYNWEM